MTSIYSHTRRITTATLLASMLLAPTLQAQTTPSKTHTPTPEESRRNAELFYEVLLGEFNASSGEMGTAYSFLLDAARKSTDENLYRRAADLALMSRSGEAALAATRAWKQALPQSREANRYELQILLAMGRIADTVAPLQQELAAQTTPEKKAAILASIPPLYARASDKKQALDTVERALANALAHPDTAVVALTTLGRMRSAAGDTSGALDAARQAQKKDPLAEGPALLAIEMMGPNVPLAEPIVHKYLDGKPQAQIRLAYARALAIAQRYDEAAKQLKIITAAEPDLADAWMLQGTLQLQQNQYEEAESSLKTYINLAQAKAEPSDTQSRGQIQAWLLLAQSAEKRKDYAAAVHWLNQIAENAQAQFEVQTRRASLLAAQGKLQEALDLLHKLPTTTPEQKRLALLAEVQLLRDSKQYQTAFDLLASAVESDPTNSDLIYEQAMMADKLGRLDEMERLLREIIANQPDYYHAYNALGYSLADRGVRLTEARDLIRKALEFAPNDPFIQDSLGWVEFRLGRLPEALQAMESAYQTRQDTEIAAHLGEILWKSGQKERAMDVWKKGREQDATNEVLNETLKRLQVKW